MQDLRYLCLVVVWYFIFRYKVLFRGKTRSRDNSDCTMLLQDFDPDKQSFKLGKTKVITATTMTDNS